MKLTVPFSVFATCIALLCLQGIGLLFPSAYNWGFHFLGYLPISFSVILLLIGVTAIAIVSFLKEETILNLITEFYTWKPYLFLISACAIYIALAFIFRIRVPLLGDSYVIINIIEHALSGEQTLRPYSEPLSVFFFYGLAKFMGATESASIQQAFFTGELILGIGFIINTFFIARCLFEESVKRVLLFGSLLVLPSLIFFFGYVEWYPVVLYCLSLCMLTIILYVNEKLPIYVVMLSYALLVMAHLLSGLLFPALIFLAYKEIKTKGYKNIAIGLEILILIFFTLYWQFNFNVMKLMPREEQSLFLSVFPDNSQNHAYTLFSFYHAIDLLNLFILLLPFELLLLFLVIPTYWKTIISSIEAKLFLLYSIPLGIFIFLFQFDLGMAKDWDIPATFAFPVYLFTIYFFLRSASIHYRKIMSLVIVMSACLLIPYFQLNATVEQDISRFNTMLNSPFMSEKAYFCAVSHLSKYYYNDRKKAELDTIWTRFSTKYPKDWRGYRALTNSKLQLGNPNDPDVARLYDEWIERDTTKQSMKDEYIHYCLDMSKYYYHKGTIDSAFLFNYRAIKFDSNSATVYNNLGVLYKAGGNNEKAIEAYRKAIELDTTYVLSYINLANTYDEIGNPEQAIVWYKNGLAHDSTNSDIYENMAITYYKMKDSHNYILSLSRAAQLGNREAQQYLLKNGVRW